MGEPNATVRRAAQISLLALTVLLVSSAPTIGQPGSASTTVACRNTTADDETINNAIAASVPGDEIVIGGTCLVDRPIRLVGERTYRGGHRAGTVIRQANGANLDAMLASDTYLDNDSFTGAPFTIRSLTLDGNRADRMFATTIADNYIEDFTTAGLRVSLQGDASSAISGNKIFQFMSGTAGQFLETRVNYGTGNLTVVGNAIRGNGSGVGLDLQKGPGVALVVTSTGNVVTGVTGVTTPRRVGTGVTVTAGV